MFSWFSPRKRGRDEAEESEDSRGGKRGDPDERAPDGTECGLCGKSIGGSRFMLRTVKGESVWYCVPTCVEPAALPALVEHLFSRNDTLLHAVGSMREVLQEASATLTEAHSSVQSFLEGESDRQAELTRALNAVAHAQADAREARADADRRGRERDQARSDRAQANRERGQAQRDLAVLASQNLAVEAERNALRHQQDHLRQERDLARQERDRLREERDQLALQVGPAPMCATCETSKPVCLVCQERPATYTATPCMHMYCCEMCKDAFNGSCAVCRGRGVLMKTYW